MASSGSGSGSRMPSLDVRNIARLMNSVERAESVERGSAGSSWVDERPNNWDFSSWQPSTTFDNTGARRMKKANEAKKQNHGGGEWERQRGEGDRSSQKRHPTPQTDRYPAEEGRGNRTRTPASVPRTRGPLAQKSALENLRQELSYSEEEEAVADALEWNNERSVVRDRSSNTPLQDMEHNEVDRKKPSQNGTEEEPDSNQIVGRLMQIRDYIKQANSMMVVLKDVPDSKSKEQLEKMTTLVSHLKDQEKNYLGLLQKILSSRGDDLFMRQNSSAEVPENQQESESEAMTELDAIANSSEDEQQPTNIPPMNLNNIRPIIEDRLGRHGDTDNEAQNSARSSNIVNEDLSWDDENAFPGLSDLITQRSELQSFLANKNDELTALRQQQELLKQMLQQQEQLKALHGRHAALTALRMEAEQQIDTSSVALNNEGGSVKSDNREEVESGGACGGDEDLRSQDLKELRHRLDYLKNLYDIKAEQASDVSSQSNKPARPARPPKPPQRAPQAPSENNLSAQTMNSELEQLSIASTERKQLQDKLQQLQQKKLHMDSLLHELHSMRADRFLPNNHADADSHTSSVNHMADGMMAAASADNTAQDAEELLAVLDARNKLKKLQDVKERLGELKDLVQYYQSGNQFIHGQSDGATGCDYEDVSSMVSNESEDTRMKNRVIKKEVDNNIDPTDTTDSTSQVSSSAEGWSEDPLVQEKVRRLKEAKEKLRRLQELVAMVQQSPDLAHALPNDLSDLTTSMLDDNDSQFSSSQAGRSPSAAVAAVSRANNITDSSTRAFQNREELFERKMAEQQEELRQLMVERDRLLHVQGELQHLHETLPTGASNRRERSESINESQHSMDKCSKTSETEAPRPSRSALQDVTVTFQDPLETVVSNEELFDRMRQQRILREELRERKKELEQFMSKGNDRPRRHYGRNQDNQSDNISYSNKSYQDGASASEDVTMATWGGSTAGNLESIEEGEGGRRIAMEENEEDDAYPSDGVVQVEEEEEANGDSDRDTYTIEHEDYSSSARSNNRRLRQHQLPIVEGATSQDHRRQQQRQAPSAPFQDGSYTYNDWSPNNQILNNTRQTRVKSVRRKKRQQRGLSADDNPILYKMQQDIRELRSQLQVFAQNSPSSSDGLQQHCSQLQQQQLLMGLNSCYYQLLQQHQQLIERFNTLETYLFHHENFSSRSPRSRPFEPDPQVPESFFNVDDRLLTTASIPRKVASKRSPSDIPIETIQAQDDPVALRLNLDDAVRPKKQKSPKSQNQSNEDVVIGRRFPTPVRAGAAAMLAQQKAPPPCYRPGLSAGISGTAFNGASSISSAVSSLPGQEEEHAMAGEGGEGPQLSLFETLRETIYSEVATLISQNENRPHFLIELFRELQLLSSDYLRQRALYSIQDLVTKYLTDDKLKAQDKPQNSSSNLIHSVGTNTNELPDATTDDEEIKTIHASNRVQESRSRFDYEENVATTSSLSTPTSCADPSGSWDENPFAQDSLGNTVIHLDQLRDEYNIERAAYFTRKALRRMRDYESKLSANNRTDPHGASPAMRARPSPAPVEEAQSDGSVSDVTYPRIDTQQLDKQIKSIMTQIIPVLKEHMGEVCSPQLLLYVRRLVLSLAERPPTQDQGDQRPQGQEFVRFFKNQLASILQDSLAKFEGRKMRECGEDMLVEMSEILFNELAFFRLMQDLDDPKAKVKARLKQWREDSCTSQTSTETAVTQDEFPGAIVPQDTEEDDDEASSMTSSSRIDDALTSGTEDNNKKQDEEEEEEEELAKRRDDAFAMEMASAEEKVKIMLAPSETKPYTRIGSDEDDEAEDEVASNGEPSETAVSRDAERAAAFAQSPTPSTADEEQDRVNGNADDDDVEADLTPNDLPVNLTVISKDELNEQLQKEQEAMAENLLQSMTEANGESELAGDPMALKQPVVDTGDSGPTENNTVVIEEASSTEA